MDQTAAALLAEADRAVSGSFYIAGSSSCDFKKECKIKSMTKTKASAFAFVVTMAAMAIDMMVHMSGEPLFGVDIAVHLPYVLVKTTIVLWTLFWFSRWVGVNGRDGIVASFMSSVLFDIYYNYAEPTLDRTIFTLDEAATFIVIHFFCIVIPYLILWKWLMVKSENGAAVDAGYSGDVDEQFLYKITGAGIIVGSIFLFPTKHLLKVYNLFVGLTYNDHVLIGSLAFILVIVALYKIVIRPKRIV